MGLFGHRRAPSMGQPLLDQGADAHDILPPSPEHRKDADAPFESPNHATKKWLRRNTQRPTSFRRSAGGAKEFSYADQMRIQALQEYQRRLAEPVNLSNQVLIDFSSRMLAELDMRPHKTSLASYAKTFTANEFIRWAMTQPEVRDQCDALFIGSELLCRTVFLPVSYSRADALFSAPTLKPGNTPYRLVAKKKAEVVAAIFGKNGNLTGNLTVDVQENGLTDSAQVSPSGTGSANAATGAAAAAAGGSFAGTCDSNDHSRRTRSDSEERLERSNPASGRKRPRGILKRRRASALGDIAEFEAYRKFRFLPKSFRVAAFRANQIARRKIHALKKSYRRTAHSAYAPVRAVRGYLSTRLGPHTLFTALAPLLFLKFFADHFALALVVAWWCWRHAARVDARQRRDLERRVKSEELARFQGRRGYAKLHKDGSETADWWSEVLRSFWDGWIEFWLNRLLTRVLTDVLNRAKPAYLEMLEITTFKLGEVPPQINSSRCWRGNEGETIVEWDLVWETKEMNIALSAKVGGSKFAVPVPLRVFASDLRIAGKFRLGLFWTRRKGGPYLRRLRVSFVDVPEHSVVIKPMTSSFIDVRDLPGVDNAVENALNKLFTNVLVEPNCVNWDVEKWWINRPIAQAGRGAFGGADGILKSGSLSAEDRGLFAEAERIRLSKEGSVSSMLAAGAGYSKKPTLRVSISVHLAEMETREDAAATSYFAKLKRGAKKFTTDGAKAVPTETLVSKVSDDGETGGFGSRGGTSSLGSSVGGESDDGLGGEARESFRDAREKAHARSVSAGTSPFSASSSGNAHRSLGASCEAPSASGHTRRASDFPASGKSSVEKKWICRPVWEEFVRLDAFEKRIDPAVHVRVLAATQRGSRSKSVLGQGVIPNVLDFADGRLHTAQVPLTHPRSGVVVGVIHLRVRATKLNEHVVASERTPTQDASFLKAPSVYTKQFALNAADVLATGASGVAAVMGAGLGTLNPIPKKYVDSAANGIKSAAFAAVNEPARRGRWAFRSVYKGCKKMYLGKETYKALRKEKITQELEAAKRAAGYSEAWKANERFETMARSASARRRLGERWRRGGSLGDASDLEMPMDDGYQSADSLFDETLDETGGERVPDSDDEIPTGGR